MMLSEYIKGLQAMLEEIEDTDLLFTSVDDEGNGYNRAGYAPEIRLICKDDMYRPKEMIEPRREDEPLEEWLDNNCLDEEDIKNLLQVVLL